LIIQIIRITNQILAKSKEVNTY